MAGTLIEEWETCKGDNMPTCKKGTYSWVVLNSLLKVIFWCRWYVLNNWIVLPECVKMCQRGNLVNGFYILIQICQLAKTTLVIKDYLKWAEDNKVFVILVEFSWLMKVSLTPNVSYILCECLLCSEILPIRFNGDLRREKKWIGRKKFWIEFCVL